MQRSPEGARRVVRASNQPIAAWARALGISRPVLSRLLAGETRYQHGPTMRRMLELVDALDNGRAVWEKTKAHGWELRTRYTFAPSENRIKVDFLGMRMVR